MSSPWSPPRQSPAKAPVSASENTVGLSIIRDFEGSLMGISITSIRKRAVRSSPGVPSIQFSNSSSSRTLEVPEL